jgi:hypothetical protein
MEFCPACDGELTPLGSLGTLDWYRCRACGLDVGSCERGEREGKRLKAERGERTVAARADAVR